MTSIIKKCNKCRDLKDIGEFPKRKDSPDGHRNICKTCRKEYQTKYHTEIKYRKKEIEPEGYKKCRKCGELKTTDNFGRSKKNKDGLKSYCKACKNKESKKHRENNPEYYQKYREGNKEKATEYGKEYRENNKTKLAQKAKKYAEINANKIQEYKKEWYEKNKDKVMNNKRRRRDRKVACGEEYSLKHRQITLIAFNYKCYNCGNDDKLHIDHHRPLIRGNPLSLDNAVVLCKTCNLSKGTKRPEDFYTADKCIELEIKLASIKENAS
jgi:hypothetical protein